MAIKSVSSSEEAIVTTPPNGPLPHWDWLVNKMAGHPLRDQFSEELGDLKTRAEAEDLPPEQFIAMICNEARTLGQRWTLAVAAVECDAMAAQIEDAFSEFGLADQPA